MILFKKCPLCGHEKEEAQVPVASKPLDYTPAYRNDPFLSKDTVRYQPEERVLKMADGSLRHFNDLEFRALPQDTWAESHSHLCDCPTCVRYRRANHYTPFWWRSMIEDGRIPLDYVSVNAYPYQDGTYGVGDMVFHEAQP